MDILRDDMSMTLKRIGGKDDGGIDFFGWWWLPHESLSSSSSPNEETCRHHRPSAVLRRRRIRVIGQCKAEKKKIGPNYIRELEGVLYRFLTQKFDNDDDHPYPLLDEGDDEMSARPYSEFIASSENPSLSSSPAIALLVSQSAFTKSTVLRANSSPIPFCLLHLPPVEPARVEENVMDVSEQQPSDNSGEPTPSSSSSGNLLGSVWCNPALCGARGLLKGRMEVRWERHLENVGARPALWWDGIRLASWVPDFTAANSRVERN